MYSLSVTSEGTDPVYTYSVHTGAQFGVECSSIATIKKPFSGEVTWYKKMTVSGLYRHRYATILAQISNWLLSKSISVLSIQQSLIF